MKPLHVQQMLKRLGPVLKDSNKAETILKKYWNDKIALVWSVYDIHKAANERGIAVSEDDAQKLLHELNDEYNPQYGIRWTDLWDLIQGSGLGRKMTKQEVISFVNTMDVVIAQQR
jgi:hypothetical protein